MLVAPEQLPRNFGHAQGRVHPNPPLHLLSAGSFFLSNFADQSSKLLKRVRWMAASSDPYSGHDFGGRTDWVDEEPEEKEDAWQLTGR